MPDTKPEPGTYAPSYYLNLSGAPPVGSLEGTPRDGVLEAADDEPELLGRGA